MDQGPQARQLANSLNRLKGTATTARVGGLPIATCQRGNDDINSVTIRWRGGPHPRKIRRMNGSRGMISHGSDVARQICGYPGRALLALMLQRESILHHFTYPTRFGQCRMDSLLTLRES